jgi:hypothetical protein
MSPSPYQRQAPSPWLRVAVVFLTLIVGGVGLVVLLAAGGLVQFPFLRKPAVVVKAKPLPDGLPVLVSARAIPAYAKVTRDHVLDVRTGELSVVYVRPEDAAREGFLTFDKIVGRVLKGEKSAGYAFRDEDFLPEGVRPGVVAGVPLGKRAFVVEADKIQGAYSVRLGDRVDLLASVPIDMEKTLAKYKSSLGPSLAFLEMDTDKMELPRRASVKALAQGALVVLPVSTREVPLDSGATGRDGKPKTRPIREITFAVAPAEVGPLTEALAVNANITCVAHSGLPGDRPTVTPSMPHLAPRVLVVESIVGKKHDVMLFPAPPQAPAKPAPRPEEPAPSTGQSVTSLPGSP